MVIHVWVDGAAPTHVNDGVPGGGNWWGERDHRTKGFTVLGANEPLVAEVGAVIQALKDIYKSRPGEYYLHTDHGGIVNVLGEIEDGKYEYDQYTDPDDLEWSERVYFKLFKIFRSCPRTHTVIVDWTDRRDPNMKYAHYIARQAMEPESRDHKSYMEYYSNKKIHRPDVRV